MSPRAASRLESLGFTRVYDYVAGQADWLANGLPTEGRDAKRPSAGDVATRDVPTCHLSDRIGEVRARVQAAGRDSCLVVNDAGVVLGRLRGDALDQPADTPAEQVMEAGPTTIRPDTELTEVAERMRKQGVTSIIVTTTGGHLVGILNRAAAEHQQERTP
ncbi:MAG: CBS domain-containing protein [Thermomicrobiales bacterium]